MMFLRFLRRYWWVVLPALAVPVGFWWQSGTGAIRERWAVITGAPPAIEYPAVLDLGERTANEVVASRFEIRNRGGQELVINQVRSSCSCGALEREVDGNYEAVQELRLPPGGRAELVVRLTVRTDRPGTFNQTVSFLTNDPAQAERRITVVFRTRSGGIRLQPNAVQFGRLPIGRDARQVVDVLDRDSTPQTVARVVSSDPDRVAVRWVPTPAAERSEAGLLLGRVELVPNTAQPLLLDTTVTVAFADPKIEPVPIPVSGRVAPRVEVIPESLVLPQSAGSGPIYTGTCLVRGPDNQPISLEIESTSPEITAEIPDVANGPIRRVRITWVPVPGEGSGVTKKTVRLRIKIGEESDTVEIPVTCERQ